MKQVPEQNDTYQLIEDYINNVLSPADCSAFEVRLTLDSALKEQYDLHLLANDLVLEKRLSHLNTLVDTEKSTQQKNNILKKGLLGGLVLSTILAIVYFSPKEETTIVLAPTEKMVFPIIEPTIQENIKLVPDTISKKETLTNIPSKEIEKTHLSSEDSNVQLVENNSVAQNLIQPIKKSTQPVAITNPCDTVSIHFKASTNTICEGLQNGTITSSNITGGTPPLTPIILNEYQEEVVNHSLKAGIYHIQLRDKNDCKSAQQQVEIVSKRCLEDYSISKAFGTSVKIPAFDEAITFTVLNQNNTVYFETEFNAFEDIEWKGENNQTQIVEGYYLLLITTEKGQELTGSITILP